MFTSLQWRGTQRRDLFTLSAITGRQQARRSGQTFVASAAAAAAAAETATVAATSRRQEAVIYGSNIQAQVPGGLRHFLVTGRQWASLLGCERRREAENHTAASHVYGQRHQEETRTVFGKPESHHGQDFRPTDRRHEQGVPDIFGR